MSVDMTRTIVQTRKTTTGTSHASLDSIVIGRALLLVQVDKPGSKLTLSCLSHFLLARVAKIKQALSKDPAGD